MLIAEFTLSSPVMRDALGEAPGTTVELGRVASERPTRVSVLARGQDMNRFEDALTRDRSVEEVAVRGRGPAFGEYEVTLTRETEERTTSQWWESQGLEPLSVAGTSQGWNVRMRFPSRESLATYRDICRERDLSFTLHDVYQREELVGDDLSLANERVGDIETDLDDETVDAAADADAAPSSPRMDSTAHERSEEAVDDDD
jgi:hypothetical protein